MSARQPDECHGGVPTGSVGRDGQGRSSGSVGDAQSGTERGLAALEDRLRGALAETVPPGALGAEWQRLAALADARQAVIDAVREWYSAWMWDPQGDGIRAMEERLAAAWDELLRIEGQR